MTYYLVRVETGWALFDDHNKELGRFHVPSLYEACIWFRVRRIMFGSYTWPDGIQTESWKCIPTSETADL